MKKSSKLVIKCNSDCFGKIYLFFEGKDFMMGILSLQMRNSSHHSVNKSLGVKIEEDHFNPFRINMSNRTTNAMRYQISVETGAFVINQ